MKTIALVKVIKLSMIKGEGSRQYISRDIETNICNHSDSFGCCEYDSSGGASGSCGYNGGMFNGMVICLNKEISKECFDETV